MASPSAGPAALAHLRLCGVASLRDRQAVANRVSRAVREGLLDASARAAVGSSPPDPQAMLANMLALLTAVTHPWVDGAHRPSRAGADQILPDQDSTLGAQQMCRAQASFEGAEQASSALPSPEGTVQRSLSQAFLSAEGHDPEVLPGPTAPGCPPPHPDSTRLALLSRLGLADFAPLLLSGPLDASTLARLPRDVFLLALGELAAPAEHARALVALTHG
eukprot:scaffold21969_cov91-Isochrysis_galbana.AAC.1